MEKSSLYLSEEQAEKLRRIAAAEGRSQADVVRSAIEAYPDPKLPRRRFRAHAIAEGPGGSIADVPEEEALEGFGES